jgi:hypothetical protein
MEGETRGGFRLTFGSLDSAFFIVPDFDGFVFTGSSYQGFADADVHSDDGTGMVVQIYRFQSEPDCVLVIFVFYFTSHK